MSIPSGPRERLTALGHELIEIHRRLREDLAALQDDVDGYLDAGGGTRPRELKVHCLAFCSALARHHTGEDAGAFPILAARHPELRSVIAQLAQDHRMMSSLLQSLESVVGGISGTPNAAEAERVRLAVNGIAAIMESHFRFEERRIVEALDQLSDDVGTAEDLFGFTGD